MSPNPETAKICEKLLFLPSFRVYGSDVPEEQLLTKVSISKPGINVNHLHKNLIDSMIAKKMESKETSQ